MRILTFGLLLSALLLMSCGSSGDTTYSVVITAVPAEAGSVTPANGEFESGRALEIAATPNQHWVFVRWEGDHQGTGNPSVITLNSDKDIAAIFEKKDYPLTVLVEGEGTVEEEVVQERTTEHSHGTKVQLTASPSSGWMFREWLGDADGDENPLVVTIDGDTEITALFTRTEHPVTINIVGEGKVLEKVVQQKTEDYIDGTLLELTAQPDENWLFSAWSGDVEGDENPVELLVDGPKELTATFLRSFSFTTVAEPADGGVITPDAGNYIADTTIEVAAEANNGWRFVDWEGDFSGSENPFSLTMDGDKTVQANFERVEYILDIEEVGQGSVSVTLVSGAETAGGYEFESVVELTATAGSDWRFLRWEGDVTSTDNPVTVTMDDDKSIRAVFSFFNAGSGTASNPYQIINLEQLDEVRNHLNSHFILKNDIDATETSLWNSNRGFDPIGDDNDPFKGTFDGGGFTISDLAINRPNEWFVGLFGYIEGGTVRNVTLQAASVTGDERVGAIAGENGGNIASILVTGIVTGDTHVGGLTGINSGQISSSASTVDVTGSINTGGLVGVNSGQISDSESSGAIQGGAFRTGGLAGNNSGSVVRSFSTSTVDGGGSTGGLIGRNRGNGVVSESYATGDVTGDERVGGLVGRNDDGSPLIEASYANGDVSGTSAVGGLVGSNTGGAIVNQCYSTGTVSGTDDIAGFAGRNNAGIANSYWDTESSGMSEGIGTGNLFGVEGLETAEMTGSEAQDFMTDFNWVNIWKTTAGYPVQQWQ